MLVDASKLKTIQFVGKLDTLYDDIIGRSPECTAPNSLVVFTQFSNLIDEHTEANIRKLFADTPDLAWTVRENRDTIPFYDQGVVVFLIYLLKRHRNRLMTDWPIEWRLLQTVATNIGVSLDT